MIRHTVVFTLKHEAGSSKERDFLEAARQLATIATVEKFEQLRQLPTALCTYRQQVLDKSALL